MTVKQLRDELSKFPDDMRVICFDGEQYDDAYVVEGAMRGNDGWLYTGHGCKEFAQDDAEDMGDEGSVNEVCTIKPGFA